MEQRGTIFYSDAHMKYLLDKGPRYCNMYLVNGAYVSGAATIKPYSKEAYHRLWKPLYRVIITAKPKF